MLVKFPKFKICNIVISEKADFFIPKNILWSQLNGIGRWTLESLVLKIGRITLTNHLASAFFDYRLGLRSEIYAEVFPSINFIDPSIPKDVQFNFRI